MSKPKIPAFPAPDSLADEGKRIWEQVTSRYALRPDELLALEDACAASDMVASLQKAWVDLGRPLITKGSMGQEVEHPLIGSIDKQRKSRNALWRQLKLPDEAGGAVANQQRGAAQTRWAQAHGTGV